MLKCVFSVLSIEVQFKEGNETKWIIAALDSDMPNIWHLSNLNTMSADILRTYMTLINSVTGTGTV